MTELHDWQQWRQDRGTELAAPHGWLSLTALHFLPTEPTEFAGIPGRWSASELGAHLQITPDEDFTPCTGADPATEYTWDVAEAQSLIIGSYLPVGREPADQVHIELARRTRRLLIRTRDPLAPARTAFTGLVPSFDYSAQWVHTVPVSWYDQPRAVVVQAAQAGLEHHLTAVGEVSLPDGASTAKLQLVGAAPGAPAQLLFTDGRGPQLPWRVVTAQPVGADQVEIDFNRAANLPFAFSDFGTCPAPVAGNALPYPVTAGELVPR